MEPAHPEVRAPEASLPRGSRQCRPLPAAALMAPQPHPEVPTLSLPSDLSPFPLCCVHCAQRLCAHFTSLLPPRNPLHRVFPLSSEVRSLAWALHPCPSHLLQHPLPYSAASPADTLSPESQWSPWPPGALPRAPANPSPSPLNPRDTVCASCLPHPPTRLTLTARAMGAPRPLQGTFLGRVFL